MSEYDSFCDDFYVNMNLSTEMELPQGRESILHYFEQIRRRFPKMQNFYSREKSEFVLEEEKEAGAYRWVSLESKRVNSGVVNPENYESAIDQHRAVLERVPFDLSISPLDCESLGLMFGFDFAYRGNHNELLTEVIGISPGLESMATAPHTKLLSAEPSIQFALDEDCKTQCRVSFETRTTAYQVRTGEFGEDQLSVYLTIRRYDSLDTKETYADEILRLSAFGRDIVDDYLVPSVLRPLQQAISLR